jgi:hypothetical protein
MTLGKRLKEREVRDAALAAIQANEEAERRAREEAAMEQKFLEEVTGYFARVRSEIVEDIQADKAVRRLTLGIEGDGTAALRHILGTANWKYHNNRIDYPTHKYHAVWREFNDWATSEELDISFEYKDDEFTGEWLILHVKAFA